MAYGNYSQGVFKRKDTSINRLASAVKSATGGNTIKLPNGKKAVKYPPVQGNMNRVTDQPRIKVQDFDTGRKTNKLQTTPTSTDSGAIVTKQKDNTVPAKTAVKFTPKVNAPAKAVQTTRGTSKSPNDMNYATETGKKVDGTGKPQNHVGIGGPAGSKKVAFATMKKGKTMPSKKPKVTGVTEVAQKNNNVAGANSYGYRKLKK